MPQPDTQHPSAAAHGHSDVPALMSAAQFDHYGPPSVLHINPGALTPGAAPNTVLVRARASSVNAADVDIRSGKLKAISGRKLPRGAGFDFAGEVVKVGQGVGDFIEGDQVWGFLNNVRNPGPVNATAEYVAAPVDRVAYAPKTIDPVGAAALPGAGGAAVGAFQAARLAPGERVLIRGAAGGVGVAAVQIAVAMGATVTALVRSSHRERITDLGATEAFDYTTTEPSELGRFDVILDTVAKNMRAYRRLLTPGGRMVTMNIGSKADAAYWIVSRIHAGRRVRFVQSPPDRALLTTLAGHVDSGAVVPVIDNVYPLAQIVAAHQTAEAGGAFGKQVIRIA